MIGEVPGFGSAPFGLFPSGEGADDFPPFVGSWSPFAGAAISRLGTVEFDVVDDYGVLDTHVVVVYPAGVTETVFTEAGGFSLLYKRGSARKPIEGGYHWTLRRTTGWPSASVLVSVTAVDLAGNVGTGQASFP
jgi:hypothetical protein